MTPTASAASPRAGPSSGSASPPRSGSGARSWSCAATSPRPPPTSSGCWPARSCGPSGRSATSSSTSTTGPCWTPTGGSPGWSAWPWTSPTSSGWNASGATAQEEERRRLAGDLHDDAVQSLTAARMHLSILDQVVARLGGEAAAAVQPALDLVHGNLEQGLAAARTFLFNLRPPLLDSAGLEPALRQQLAKLAERTGCKTEVTWLLDERLDRDLEMVAFRVVQEALANVAKHADASTVRVWGEREGSMVVIAVADDGVGFDPQVASERAAATGHLGLRSMAERIQTAGGHLEISSRPYQGTQVVLRLPG